MEISKWDIVRAEAGREKGKLFLVLAEDGDYLLLADGKVRTVEKPKRKKRRHVRFVDGMPEDGKMWKDKITNSNLRRVLAVYRGAEHPEKPDQEG